MGNWRTVNIVGSCAPDEVEALKEALNPEGDNYDVSPLYIGDGLMGIGNWVAETINARGNLYERDYSVDSVVSALWKLVEIAPSLKLKVHCGGDYEDEKCCATITVEDGNVERGAPEIEKVSTASEDEMKGRLFSAMMRPGLG